MTGEAQANPIEGGNPKLKNGMHYPNYEHMPNLRAGIMYGGVIYNGQASFYGHNSEKRLYSVQNWIHRRSLFATPYFPDRGFSSKPYSYSGTYHSNYLFY